MEEVLAAAARAEPELDVARLRRDLAAVRRRGFVVTHSELDEGASGVAAPILDPRERLVAGLTIVGPSERIREIEPALVDGVLAGAREVGVALGK